MDFNFTPTDNAMLTKDALSFGNSAIHYQQLQGLPVQSVREHIRKGAYTGQTAGLCLGFLQCNLVILPASFALDFMRYCQRNSKACPLISVSDTGKKTLPGFGDINVCTDVPSYDIYHGGKFAGRFSDIGEQWQDDFVVFALGCSFSFEHALMVADVSLRHIENNTTVPMYLTSVQTKPAGAFSGELVVSMRPIKNMDVKKVTHICQQYLLSHGIPVHEGSPNTIGISDLTCPDFGDESTVLEDEIPVFWACGVTSHNAIMRACPPIAIVHTPGHMLITDLPDDFAGLQSHIHTGEKS